MVIKQSLGENPNNDSYKPPIVTPNDSCSCGCDKKRPLEIRDGYGHYPDELYGGRWEDHADHYIQTIHHPGRCEEYIREPKYRPPHYEQCDHHNGQRYEMQEHRYKPHKNPRYDIREPGKHCEEHPRRGDIKPLDLFDTSCFPKQEIMLLDITSTVRKIIDIQFKYTNGTITRSISEGDIIHAYYIDRGDSETFLTEITGKISYIDYQTEKIYIDYSERFESSTISIYISQLRFISTDLYEQAPFLDKENDDYNPPYIPYEPQENPEEPPIYEPPKDECHHKHHHDYRPHECNCCKPKPDPDIKFDDNLDPGFGVDPEEPNMGKDDNIDPDFSVDPENPDEGDNTGTTDPKPGEDDKDTGNNKDDSETEQPNPTDPKEPSETPESGNTNSSDSNDNQTDKE